MSRNSLLNQLQALNERIGYPNGLDSNNVTDLENKYAEVGYIST